jgi:hypothetical protein
MAVVNVPMLADYETKLKKRLEKRGPVVRYENLVDEDSLEARKALDELVIDGAAARAPVGDQIVVRDLRGDPDREKGWPYEIPN